MSGKITTARGCEAGLKSKYRREPDYIGGNEHEQQRKVLGVRGTDSGGHGEEHSAVFQGRREASGVNAELDRRERRNEARQGGHA